jgi:GNAT superfamily N-acetyltransferase
VIRSVSGPAGWNGVTGSDLDEAGADAAIAVDVPTPPGMDLKAVVDEYGVAMLVAVHDEVFGGDHTALGAFVLEGLVREPSTVAAVVAYAVSTPISAGRVEFRPGTDFARLWGGGTLLASRGQGVFRSLVAQRARLAAQRGFRYLQVDASPESRPILERLGFVALATTTPFTHPGAAG